MTRAARENLRDSPRHVVILTAAVHEPGCFADLTRVASWHIACNASRGMADEPELDLGHPRGTLLVVGVFGLLFGAAWFALFLIRFLGTGAPHH